MFFCSPQFANRFSQLRSQKICFDEIDFNTNENQKCSLREYFLLNITSGMDQVLFDSKQVNLPFTVALVKPDTVLEPQKLQQIIDFIENSKQLAIKNMLQRELLKEQVTNLYYKHQNKPYFEDILRYMMSGECLVMILVNAQGSQGDPIQKWKKIIGTMNPEQAKKANPECLRGKYGKSVIKNELHGSDNLVQANKERKIFHFKVPQEPPKFKYDPYKITLKSIHQFLRPPNLQHSCINERMDLLATYGPVVDWHSIEQCFCMSCKGPARDIAKRRKMSNKLPTKVLKEQQITQIFAQLCQKCQDHCTNYTHLPGGRQIQHLLTDNQLAQLGKQINKNQLIDLLTIQKGSTAKIMVSKMSEREPNQIQYNMDFFNILIKQIEPDYYQRYDFTELQNLVLEDRRIRMTYWVAKMTGKSVDRFPPVTSLDNTLTPQQLSDPKGPYFTLNRKLPLTLLIKPEQIKHIPLLYPPSIIDKKKLAQMEQNLVIEKLLHRNLTKVTQVGKKNEGIREAVSLLRPYHEGRHGDWDNYSVLKGISVKGQVGGHNMNTYMSGQSQ